MITVITLEAKTHFGFGELKHFAFWVEEREEVAFVKQKHTSTTGSEKTLGETRRAHAADKRNWPHQTSAVNMAQGCGDQRCNDAVESAESTTCKWARSTHGR